MPRPVQLELPLAAPLRRLPRRGGPQRPRDVEESLVHLGRRLRLCLDGGRARAERVGGVLYLPLPPQAGAAQIRDRAEGWQQSEARRLLGELLAACARRLGLPPPAWRLAYGAGTAVTVEADGRFRLPWRLVQLAPQEIEGRLQGRLEVLRLRAGLRGLWDDDAGPA